MQVGPQDEPSPSNINFPLQHEPPPSNMNHPPTKKRKSTQSPNSNMGVAQEVREMIVSVIKYWQKCHVNIFLMCFDLETLKPAL